MAFFNNIESENIAARVTNKGRQKIAQGNFNIEYFQVGDSEFDYTFSEFDGTNLETKPPQKVFVPLDKDLTVKYPYKLSESTVTGTTYGIPIQVAETTIISNNMGAAGFVSEYVSTGSTIDCSYDTILLSKLSGTTTLYVSTGFPVNCEYITIAFKPLTGTDPNAPLVTSQSNSLIYRVVTGETGSTYNTLTLDRNTPNLSGFTGSGVTICNNCDPFWGDTVPYQVDCMPVTQLPGDRQDPWTLNIVWTEKPAGLDVPYVVDENLTGYTSNIFASTKEYFGYTSVSGQPTNTGTTIVNSLGDIITIPPDEQHSLAIIHYAGQNTSKEPEKFFKYEDYIGHTEEEDIEYFEIYIPFLLYHRNTGTTIGAKFTMDTDDYYINSTAQDTKLNKIKYRYLLDEWSNKVGKIFVHHKVIIFDDQEIVASLDYKSNRKYTLPIPRVAQVPVDITCTDNVVGVTTPLMAGTTGETMFISYLFAMTGNTGMTGLHCNSYAKVTGTSLNADVSVNFSTTDFTFLSSSSYTTGFTSNKFYVIAQLVTTGEQPTPDGWKIIDYTDQIPNHTVGLNISPTNMRGSRYILTYDLYDNASKYDLEDFIGELPDEPSTSPEFGDTQPFPGSVTLVRSTDIQTMRFLVNLPTGQFETTQNPTYLDTNDSKRITEVALLDSNKDILVIGKTSKPIVRTGTQIIGVKIDF